MRRIDGAVWTALLLILAQSFTIPVVAIGPSWAVWPTLPDLAVVILLAFGLIRRRSNAPRLARTPALIAGICTLGALASYALWVVLGLNELPMQQSGIAVGGYQLVRLLQATGVYWVVSRLSFDDEQRRFLGKAAGITLAILCAGVIATGIGLVPRSLFVAHLPASEAAGPWLDYILGTDSLGLGTIGYNHSYVAMQLLMLLALRLHLGPGRPLVDGGFAALVWVATFLSGARNGLAVTTLFVAAWLWKKPRQAMGAALVAVALLLATAATALRSDANLASMIERQESILSGEAQSLSGRDEIWRERLRFLSDEPIRWITGSGFGSAIQSGNNSHMLFLQLVVETGVFGLVGFLALFGVVLRALARAERPASRPIWLATVVLLVSGVTQESLLPVPAFGSFLVLYAFSAALALQEPQRAEAAPIPAR